MKWRWTIIVCATLLLAASLGALSVADATHFEDPVATAGRFEDRASAVEGGRDALDKRWGYPWYDSEADGIRHIDVRPPRPSWFSDWLTNLAVGEWFTWLAWFAVASVLFALAYALIHAYLQRETGLADDGAQGALAGQLADVERIEALPFRIERPRSDLLGEAERNYRQGNYDEAIIYLYSYQLVELDKNQIIRLARGKTNRQYLRETRHGSPLGDLVEQTMIAFEEVFFGDHKLSRARFEVCWSRVDQFHTDVAEAPA